MTTYSGDSSNEEETPASPNGKSRGSPHPILMQTPEWSPKNAKKRFSSRFDSDSEGSSSDTDGSRPRSDHDSRSRMRVHRSTPIHQRANFSGQEHRLEEDSGDASEGAYERIKRQLMGDKNASKATHTSANASLAQNTHSEQISADQSPDRNQNPWDKRTPTRTVSNSARSSRQSSPGLFVSPGRAKGGSGDVSDLENDNAPSVKQSRLQRLVARKRREREEKEKAARHDSSDNDESIHERHKASDHSSKQTSRVQSDAEAGSQSSNHRKIKPRPARKASKKAMEEMNRETQRMSRNMQLTHQAKTKTKFTTADLFKRMGFRQPQTNQPGLGKSSNSPRSSSPVRVQSDSDNVPVTRTPPSSPPSVGEASKKNSNTVATDDDHLVGEIGDVDQLPSINDLMSQMAASKTGVQVQASRTPDGGSSRRDQRDQDQDLPQKPPKPTLKSFLKSAKRSQKPIDEDSDLEILEPAKTKHIKALDDVRAKKSSESHSIHALRVLAHLSDSNHERHFQGSLTPSELKANLAQRAREQAHVEKMEKIQALKDKGVYVETEEEKERNQMQIESMIERARREADELAKREKEAAKREGKAVGGDLLDSDEDEDFAPSDDEDVQFSGSDEEMMGGVDEGSDEDEDMGDGAEADDEDEDEEVEVDLQSDNHHSNPLIDDAAEDDSEQDGANEDAEPNEDTTIDSQTPTPMPGRKKRVVAEEDSDDERQQPVTPAPKNAKTPTSKSSLAQAFGFAQQKSPAGGLSQFFGGTMAQSQSQDDAAIRADTQQDSLAFLRGLPPASLPQFGETFDEPTQDYVVEDSQNAQHSPSKTSPAAPINMNNFQSPRAYTSSQISEVPDATQDLGFGKNFSPAHSLGIEPQSDSYSTIETIMLQGSDSPIVRRKGRLQRGRRSSNVEVEASEGESDRVSDNNNETPAKKDKDVFKVMNKASKKAQERDEFKTLNSAAKGMFVEQAEESEDEYAGLGGVSDDDSGGEMDEETQRFLHEKGVKVDRAKAAEFHAEWQRARDEKDTTKLYRDITTGALRRSRDNGGDLLDWDDEDEAAARRRAAKQRREAKMRKALLSDGKLDKIAENPKRQAFFQAVADYAADDEVMFLDQEESQSQSQPLETGDATNKRKRIDEESDVQKDQDRNAMPPPKSRRTNNPRPQSALEIKRTLSSLLDEPEEGDKETVDDSQPDELVGAYSAARHLSPGEDSDKENDSDLDMEEEPFKEDSPNSTPPSRSQSPPHHKRTTTDANKRAVIDRMALKRDSNSNSNSTSMDGSGSARMAFATNSNNSFKVPSLLRRATTNASIGSNEGSLAEKSAAAGITGGSKEGVKMGGSKKSSINWHTREQERMEKINKLESQRKEERTKVGRMYAGQGGLGGLGGGAFE